ncbi:MAG: hypothetical protein KY459_12170 [Acidobacteria bacterium]|nr:hypothetical protein [Acidobacteriota bacterium]
MSYFVVCTFDLEDASREDYLNAYQDLEAMGLSSTLTSDSGNSVRLPTTTTAGKFNGQSAAAVRNDVQEQVKRAFLRRGFTSEIFVSVGGDWAWGHTRT